MKRKSLMPFLIPAFLCGALLLPPATSFGHDLQDIANFEMVYKTWPRYTIYGQEIPVLSGPAYPAEHSWSELMPYLDMEFPDKNRRNVSFSTLYVKIVGREDSYTQKEQAAEKALLAFMTENTPCGSPSGTATTTPAAERALPAPVEDLIKTGVKSGDSAALAACFTDEARKQEISDMVADAALLHKKLEAVALLRESMDIIHQFSVRKAFGGNIGD